MFLLGRLCELKPQWLRIRFNVLWWHDMKYGLYFKADVFGNIFFFKYLFWEWWPLWQGMGLLVLLYSWYLTWKQYPRFWACRPLNFGQEFAAVTSISPGGNSTCALQCRRGKCCVAIVLYSFDLILWRGGGVWVLWQCRSWNWSSLFGRSKPVFGTKGLLHPWTASGHWESLCLQLNVRRVGCPAGRVLFGGLLTGE